MRADAGYPSPASAATSGISKPSSKRARTPVADTDFARGLFEHYNLIVLPGSFLAREVGGVNPGAGFVRIALVASLAECFDAANRIRQFVQQL